MFALGSAACKRTTGARREGGRRVHRGGDGSGAAQPAVHSLPEGLLDLRSVRPEVGSLAREVVERVVELRLVQLGVEVALGGERADEPVGGTREGVLLVRNLLAERVAGVIAGSSTAVPSSSRAASTSSVLSA
jgi:hypothetical protein